MEYYEEGYPMSYDYKLFKEIFDTCEKYNFDYLDEWLEGEDPYIRIEFVGKFIGYDRYEDFDNDYDYYRTTEKEAERNIFPYFYKCWDEIKKYNVFNKYEWDYDDYPVFYLEMKKEIAEKILNKELEK